MRIDPKVRHCVVCNDSRMFYLATIHSHHDGVVDISSRWICSFCEPEVIDYWNHIYKSASKHSQSFKGTGFTLNTQPLRKGHPKDLPDLTSTTRFIGMGNKERMMFQVIWLAVLAIWASILIGFVIWILLGVFR